MSGAIHAAYEDDTGLLRLAISGRHADMQEEMRVLDPLTNEVMERLHADAARRTAAMLAEMERSYQLCRDQQREILRKLAAVGSTDHSEGKEAASALRQELDSVREQQRRLDLVKLEVSVESRTPYNLELVQRAKLVEPR